MVELAENALFYIERPEFDEKAKLVASTVDQSLLHRLIDLIDAEIFEAAVLEQAFRDFSAQEGKKLGEIAGVVRVALTGRTISPSIFEIMQVLGKSEVLNCLKSLSLLNKGAVLDNATKVL